MPAALPELSASETPAAHHAAAHQLVEQFDSRHVPVRVDRARGVLAGVKILGLASKNGRVYRPAALERSIPLYEGARVNVDHPRGLGAEPRGYEDRIGAVRNVRRLADGLYGDFHYNPKHRLAEQLLWDAEHAPENVGFSHHIVARTSQHEGQTVVEEITRVESVDLVADPATTRGLFESDSDANATASDLRESLRTLREENERLRDDLRQLHERSERRAAVERRIDAAELPRALDTALFREQCHATADDALLDRLIEARREDARLLAPPARPRSIEQTQGVLLDRPTTDAATFAAALK